MKCDKFKARRPHLCEGALISLICGCGRMYTRCIGGHDGVLGCHRSLQCHRALSVKLECQLQEQILRDGEPVKEVR